MFAPGNDPVRLTAIVSGVSISIKDKSISENKSIKTAAKLGFVTALLEFINPFLVVIKDAVESTPINPELNLSREESYLIIQSAAMKSWNSNKKFKDILYADPKIKKLFNKNDLKKILNKKDKITHINYIFNNIFKT